MAARLDDQGVALPQGGEEAVMRVAAQQDVDARDFRQQLQVLGAAVVRGPSVPKLPVIVAWRVVIGMGYLLQKP